MIDLRSDTLTKPSPEMLAAMAAAEVGDEQYLEDPSVNELQRRMAELLGKEAALFLPTATMGNQVALRALSRPGCKVVAEERTLGVARAAGIGARVTHALVVGEYSNVVFTTRPSASLPPITTTSPFDDAT